MALGCFFSAAATLATGGQRIMKATHLSARLPCLHPSEALWSHLAYAYDRSHSAARFVHWTILWSASRCPVADRTSVQPPAKLVLESDCTGSLALTRTPDDNEA